MAPRSFKTYLEEPSRRYTTSGTTSSQALDRKSHLWLDRWDLSRQTSSTLLATHCFTELVRAVLQERYFWDFSLRPQEGWALSIILCATFDACQPEGTSYRKQRARGPQEIVRNSLHSSSYRTWGSARYIVMHHARSMAIRYGIK